MNKNENYEGQEKRHKKKHARTTNKQEKVPIYTTPIQPMIYQTNNSHNSNVPNDATSSTTNATKN